MDSESPPGCILLAEIVGLNPFFSVAEEPLTKKFAPKAVVGSRSTPNTTVNPIKRRM